MKIKFNCKYCKKIAYDRPSHYKRKKRHFCSMQCYSKFRKERQPIQEHPRWQGGVSDTEAHRRWKKRNPKRMSFLKARRYARERGAIGFHTFEEWETIKLKFNNCCAKCGKKKPLTKDHIKPLSLGGSDYMQNIQPLCRNCNSKKWAKFNIYENPDLIKEV